MAFTKRFSEVCYPLDSFHADSQAAGTVSGTKVSLENYHRAVLVVDVGDMAAGATFDASIKQSDDAAGTTTKAITGKAITQLTQAGGDGNEIVCIELRTEELDVSGGFDYVYFEAVVATNAVEFSAVLYGIEPRYAPVPTTNWSEIVD